MSLYLGFVLTSSLIISPNSVTHLPHSALASGAPIAFFATKCATPSTKQHTHLTFSEDVVPYTLETYSLYVTIYTKKDPYKEVLRNLLFFK